MKYLLYIVATSLILFIFLTKLNATNSKRLINGLSGYIEIVSNWNIERINLPSCKTVQVIVKPNYIINDFDVSLSGENRVIAVSGDGTLVKLIMYTNNEDIRTILTKRIIKKPAISPDGKAIAYLVENEREHNKAARLREDWFDDWYLYLVSPNGSNDRLVSNSPWAHFKPSWFPDGKQLAISTKDLKIYMLDSVTADLKKIIDFGYAPAVSHDGKKIAYLSHDVNESIKKKIIEHSKITVGEYEAIVASRGKRHEELFEIETYLIKHAIYIYNIDTGENKKMTEEFWIEEPVIWSPDDKSLIYNDRRAVANDIFVLDVKSGDKEQLQGKHGRVMVWRK